MTEESDIPRIDPDQVAEMAEGQKLYVSAREWPRYVAATGRHGVAMDWMKARNGKSYRGIRSG